MHNSRMIFCLYSQSFIFRIHGRAFRYHPTFQHSIHFQTKIEMKMTGFMLLDNKTGIRLGVSTVSAIGSGVSLNCLFARYSLRLLKEGSTCFSTIFVLFPSSGEFFAIVCIFQVNKKTNDSLTQQSVYLFVAGIHLF